MHVATINGGKVLRKLLQCFQGPLGSGAIELPTTMQLPLEDSNDGVYNWMASQKEIVAEYN